MYGGHNVIRAFNKQADSIHDFEEINEELCDSAWKSQFFSSIMQPMMQFIGNLGYVVVCILGGYLAVKSVVDIGDIQAFIHCGQFGYFEKLCGKIVRGRSCALRRKTAFKEI